MLSGPYDNRDGRPAPWTQRPSETPLERFYGFSHADEQQYSGHVRDWEAMGLGKFGPPTVVDEAQPPFGGAHQLVTKLPAVDGKDPHGVTAPGGASPKIADGSYRLSAVWRALFGADAAPVAAR